VVEEEGVDVDVDAEVDVGVDVEIDVVGRLYQRKLSLDCDQNKFLLFSYSRSSSVVLCILGF
jgi:hypothetical protein